MRVINKFLIIILLFSLSACELDLVNPNAATEEQVLNTKDGLISLAVGVRQLYSTSAFGIAVLYTSISTRETGAMTTFSSLEELEIGGPTLNGDNERVTRLFSNVMRVKGMAENLVASVDNVSLSNDTRASLLAYGNLFRAMCLGILAQNWEQAPILNSPNNDAAFSDRAAVYAEAIRILDESAKAMEGTAIPSDLVGPFGEIDLLNTLYAYLARYYNATGNYDAAIATANKVDLGATSYFSYDAENANPIFGGFFVGTVEYAPRTNFGLPDALAPDPADGRIGFYMNIVGNTSLYGGLPVEEIAAPFFTSQTASIPAYLPGEMLLIKAESYARKGEIGNAEAALNMVRQKTADDDIYGIGAGLADTYSSGGNQAALLDEIYKNRRAELFLIGTSLDDSRRFNRPEPPTATDFASERNRNFYPYPDNERESNPNTPNDPPI
ncbi:MAG: RagB/SusD family nutrient uptake outer membrane protein [Phaeodactylibacter sp.]|nr:RagB/SusD family nutrient uptake outer membrane protein [Phaeodactylibacter sp.]MCB9050902.1 RagB/SusD family nutrient uptake outer membrane protein [Lewinellaceae bacterium]